MYENEEALIHACILSGDGGQQILDWDGVANLDGRTRAPLGSPGLHCRKFKSVVSVESKVLSTLLL